MNLQENALSRLKGTHRILRSDLEALPEAAFTKKFGDKVRTVADIVYEVNLVNDHIGQTVRGVTPFDWPEGGWVTAPEGFDQKEGIIAAFEESFGRILAMVEGFSEADMTRAVATEHGETTVFERCQFMALHGWYHSGQLNFMQTLLGDDDWHW